jgi:hypothetical protein
MSDNSSVHVVVFAHWSRGCLVHPSITQRVPQKVVYIRWSHVRPLYYLQNVSPMVPLVRPPLEGSMFGFYFLKVQSMIRLTLRPRLVCGLSSSLEKD